MTYSIPRPLRAAIVGVVFGLVLVAARGIASELITPPEAFLSAGGDLVLACDDDGFTTQLALDPEHRVSAITVGDVAERCQLPAPQRIQLVLVDASGLVLGQLSVLASATSFTVSIPDPRPLFDDLAAIRIAAVELPA